MLHKCIVLTSTLFHICTHLESSELQTKIMNYTSSNDVKFGIMSCKIVCCTNFSENKINTILNQYSQLWQNIYISKDAENKITIHFWQSPWRFVIFKNNNQINVRDCEKYIAAVLKHNSKAKMTNITEDANTINIIFDDEADKVYATSGEIFDNIDAISQIVVKYTLDTVKFVIFKQNGAVTPQKLDKIKTQFQLFLQQYCSHNVVNITESQDIVSVIFSNAIRDDNFAINDTSDNITQIKNIVDDVRSMVYTDWHFLICNNE